MYFKLINSKYFLNIISLNYALGKKRYLIEKTMKPQADARNVINTNATTIANT